MQRRQDSRPLSPTMSLVFGDTSEHSSPSIARSWRLAATETTLMTTTSNAKAATSTQTVSNIIQGAQTMIKAQRLHYLPNPIGSPQCVINVEPEYAKSVRDALEKDHIGFQTKASYDSSTCEMTFHFLPSKVHDAAASKYGQMLMVGLNSLAFNQPIEQYELRGNTTFNLPSGFKEPDMYIFPAARVGEDPTLVLEVRYSERMSQLRLDARRWLSRTPRVLLVVLIHIKKSHVIGTLPMVTVEHWTRTRRRPNGEYIYSEIWPYNNNQDYHIRLDYIFETVPPPFITNGIPHDLVIPGAIVDNFMTKIHHAWAAMI